jgi:hypothetical protein
MTDNDELEKLKEALKNFSLDNDQKPESGEDYTKSYSFTSTATIDFSKMFVHSITQAGPSNPYSFNYSSGGIYTGAGPSLGSAIGSSNSSLSVSGDADIQGKLKVNGVDVVELLHQIQDRLAIIQPNFEKLEKWEALRNAYDHYKMIEKLIGDSEPPST